MKKSLSLLLVLSLLATALVSCGINNNDPTHGTPDAAQSGSVDSADDVKPDDTTALDDSTDHNGDLSTDETTKPADDEPSEGEVIINLAPGLYDANNKLIASWDELVNNHNLFSTAAREVLNKDEFAAGVTLVIGELPSGNVIETHEFSYLNNIKNIVIPQGITQIKGEAFTKSSLETVIIPDSVVEIGYDAFSNTNLKSVRIPKNITTLARGAFGGCSKLESVVWPDTLTSIPDDLFYGCSSLKTLTWPNGLTEIGDSAFAHCDGLESVEIPDSVTSIGLWAFNSCANLKAATFPAPATHEGHTFSNCQSLESMVLPEGMTQVPSGMFSGCSRLKSVTIPNSVTSIKSGAFDNCISLTTLTIPGSVTSIETNFRECPSLVKIVNNSSVKISFVVKNFNSFFQTIYPYVIVEKDGTVRHHESIEINGDFVFYTRTEVMIGYIGDNDTVTLPTGDYILYKFKGARNVIIPDGITSIPENAFVENGSLESITIPASVTSIAPNAFYQADEDYSEWSSSYVKLITNIESITVDKNNKVYRSEGNCLIETGTQTVLVGCNTSTIPSSVTSIANNAFRGCYRLDKIVFPNSITSIGETAFKECDALTAIVLPDSLTSMGREAFASCENLKELTLSGNLKTIPDGAFRECRHIESLSIPEGVEVIGDRAFFQCRGLEYISIPNSLKEIKYGGLAPGNPSFRGSVTFNGTKEEFKEFQRNSSSWRDSFDQVVCTDGIVYV